MRTNEGFLSRLLFRRRGPLSSMEKKKQSYIIFGTTFSTSSSFANARRGPVLVPSKLRAHVLAPIYVGAATLLSQQWSIYRSLQS
jgi:hypothetical protein